MGQQTQKIRSVEEQIFRNLLIVADNHGYWPCYIGSPGERDGVRVKTHDEAIKEVFDLDDADVTFKGKNEKAGKDGRYEDAFFVRLVGGNDEDFISDHSNTSVAQKIVDETLKESGIS